MDTLAARDDVGLLITVWASALTAAGAWLSLAGPWPAWLAGQVLLGFAFTQWFVVVHECGHRTLFRTRGLNGAVGALAGLLALLPAGAWRVVHARHHRWTGWQDVDPTTRALAPRARSRLSLALLDLAWRLGVPFVSLHYRAGTFWRPGWVLPHAPPGRRRRVLLGLLAHHAATLVAVVALVTALGALEVVALLGVALLVSWTLQDLLLLSQHTHLPLRLARGERVRPIAAGAQAEFTRSLLVPRWASALLLFGFDAHTAHHAHPQVPGWRLRGLAETPINALPWWRWVIESRRLPGRVLLLQHRLETGAPL